MDSTSTAEQAAVTLGNSHRQTEPSTMSLLADILHPVCATSETTASDQHILFQNQTGDTQLPLPGLAHLADLRTYFPNHAITGHLLYHFFECSSIPWTWSIIYKPVFDTRYVTFSSSSQPPSLDFVALLAMVCACSLQFLPASSADVCTHLSQISLVSSDYFQDALFHEYKPGRTILKERLYEFSRSILLYYDSLPPSLERIQAQALLSIYQLVWLFQLHAEL